MLTLEELGHRSCRWPVGEFGPAVYLFCGDASIPGKPYCTCHAAIAYETQAQRRRRAAEWAALHPKQPSGERSRRWNQYISEGTEAARQHGQAEAAC